MDDLSINDAEQDATGQVWALSHRARNELYRWDGSRWRPTPLKFAGDAQPVALGRGHQGEVLCVWNLESTQDHWVSRHLGSDSALISKFRGPLSSPLLF